MRVRCRSPKLPLYVDIATLLQGVPYFEAVRREDLRTYAATLDTVRLRRGDVLLRQGEGGDDVYVVIDGRLRALREAPGEADEVLGEIGRGEIVGEMGALLGQPRNATVVALRDSAVLRLSRGAFSDLVLQQQDALAHLLQTVLARTSGAVPPGGKLASVALVPLHDGLDPDRFARALGEALRLYVHAEVLTPGTLSEAFGLPPAATAEEVNGRLVLHEHASTADLLVYSTAGQWDAWTRCCAARSDRLILLADADRPPERSAFERRLGDFLDQANDIAQELVLLHDPGTPRPRHTARWLSERAVARHHHLVKEDVPSVRRLARFLTGNAVGVALSGGGLRTTMQYGILLAMREGGLPIDVIGGSSGGALMGASFSRINRPGTAIPAGWIEKTVEPAIELFRSVQTLTAPVVSLFSGRKYTQAFVELFGDVQIEDLWTNSFCISLSLVTGRVVVHDAGPAWEAVRASSSLMGLFPPVLRDGDCLVDGGFVNPCPSNLVAQRGAGKVIVVSASTQSGIEVETEYAPTTSGWPLLLKKLNPFHKARVTPSIGSAILQTLYIASDHLLDQVFAESEVDLFIRPPTDEFVATDPEAMRALYDIGYAYGVRHVPSWKSALGLP